MKGDHYVVNGQKLWSTMGQFAQRCLLLVRTSSQGRFFHYVTAVPDNENLVGTNGGGTNQTAGPAFGADPTIAAYRANAAAAQFSRVIALKLYGGKRPYGYLYGGSGGGYRTLGSMENTNRV